MSANASQLGHKIVLLACDFHVCQCSEGSKNGRVFTTTAKCAIVGHDSPASKLDYPLIDCIGCLLSIAMAF